MIKDTLPAAKPIEDAEEGIEEAAEESEIEETEDSPKNMKRGARLTELRKVLSEANEVGKDEELIDEKIEFLLADAAENEPSIDEFLGAQAYYTAYSARSDKKYVEDRERDFDETERLAKIAEAVVGQAIRREELFPSIGDIKAVVNNPVTRYDDIANGIDQAVTLITEEDEAKPFAFDITIGHSDDTVIKKLFRPYKSPVGTQVDTIGQSRLKYGQDPTLDEDGNPVTRKTIDPIPRFTLAYDKRDVLKMANNVTVEKGFEEGQTEVYANPEESTVHETTLQIYEQCTFFGEAAKVKLAEINTEINKTEDAAKSAELNRQAKALREQIDNLAKLSELLEPVLKDAYKRAREKSIANKKDARTDDTDRRKLFCSGYLGSATGKFIDSMHYYEGFGDRRDEEEEKLVQAYIEEEKDKIRKQHRGIMEPSYSAKQIIDMEFDSTLRARRTMLSKYRRRMPDRLEEGFEEYERIEEENRQKRMSA